MGEKKRRGRNICALLLAFVMLLPTGCSKLIPVTTMPEDTIEEFETAVNNMDVNAMMDCMDDDAVKAATAGLDLAIGIVGAVSGVKLGIKGETLINAFPLFQGISGELLGENGKSPDVDFHVTKTLIKGNKATVYFMELHSWETSVVNMKKKDGKWVFVMDTTLITEDEADRVIEAGHDDVVRKEDDGVRGVILTYLDEAKLSGTPIGQIARKLLGADDTSGEETDDSGEEKSGILDIIRSLL